jgi:hypothetical protein
LSWNQVSEHKMTEKEIRGIIKQLFARLDQRARRGVRKVVLPTMIGAGLALSGGCSGRNVPAAQDATPQTDATTQTDGTTQQLDGLAPDPDGGPVPPYMAPDEDAGAVVEYMAPDPDGGPVYPPYMAPPDSMVADSGEPTIDYMAPDPDAGPMPQPLYSAP